MKLTSLQLTKSEAKEETIEAKEVERPRYAYGTCLYLDETVLAKLGIKDLPEVGTEIRIVAVGKVTGTSSREYEGGSHQTLDIQLVEMGCEVGPDEEDAPTTPMGKAAKTLYGGGSE